MTMDSEAAIDTMAADTHPCGLCGRKFLFDRLEKHQKICNKTKESQKRRKVFESHKQRADLEQVNGFPVTPPSKPSTASEEKDRAAKKNSNWRAKHEEFLRTVRQARGEKVDEPERTGAEQNGPRVPVGYIVCQFCGRNFSDKAADRHIEWCKEQKARIPRSATNSKALERMKARTQYKPLPNKSSPKTETPPKVMGSRSQPPTPPVNRKTSQTPQKIPQKAKPPNSLPLNQKPAVDPKTKTSPRVVPKNRRPLPSPPTKSKFVDKQRINSLSRPKNMSPDSLEHLLKQSEPVMKFKEKFPNYTTHNTNFLKNDTMKALLKKTESYIGGPRTVPGVRTGGMSPVKGDSHHQNGHYNNHQMVSEEEELEKLKTRIEEMYLNGSTKYKPNSLNGSHKPDTEYQPVINGNHNNHNKANSESTTRGSTSGSSVESSSIPTPPRDDGSADGQRSQASSAESGGLPRFCHQCGTKYPTTIAKYCYECGSRRLGTVGPFLNLD